MEIRAYKPADLEACKTLHAKQGFSYDFPNLEGPLYFIKLVGEQDGQIVQAAFAHVEAQIYFLVDPTWGTPQQRHLAFLAMQDVGSELAYKPGGLDALQAFLPPSIEKSFGKRLTAHGWKKAPWPCYFRELER